ncbi:hypothetical protein GCM10022226_74490 [Sphaerisporangium flaviroseum]|uniref:Uncharacterized protein n=1 Tax=Sphaerisporangium flaviroseum TaxID=509199 RepID=A0ABP7JCE3_9ACTN
MADPPAPASTSAITWREAGSLDEGTTRAFSAAFTHAASGRAASTHAGISTSPSLAAPPAGNPLANPE